VADRERELPVVERPVEANHHVSHVLVGQLEAGLGDRRAQSILSDHEHAGAGRRRVPQILGRRAGAPEHLVLRHVDSHPAELLDVLGRAERRVVGRQQERQLDPAQELEELDRPWEASVAFVDDPVEIDEQPSQPGEARPVGSARVGRATHARARHRRRPSPTAAIAAASIAVTAAIRIVASNQKPCGNSMTR
jgi:hypothetical protein